MSGTRLSIPIGDDGKVCVHVKDGDGEPIDISTFAEITFILKRSESDLDAFALFTGTLTGGDISILNPPKDGVCEVTVAHAATTQIMVGQPYFFKVRLTDGLGAVGTPVYGTLYGESPIQR